MILKNKMSILIVEDERSTRDGLQRLLREEYDITMAEDGIRGLNILKRHNFDLVLTDLVMPGADGMEILKATLKKEPPPVCLILTAYGSIASAVTAMKEGAYDFITKPVNLDQLEITIKRALESRRLAEENSELRRRLDEKYGFENIVGQSAIMHEVFETVKQVAPARTTILISGESGTGKELIAHAIHHLSGKKGSFIAVHCAALSTNLLESELFGHEKGAFTGAIEQKKGRFELADGGTLFLDEISEIDQSVQVKILRALETRSFERVGGTKPVSTDTRIIAATNRDLKTMVEEGNFREDLFYRLYVVTIQLPPLRDKKEDIPLLTKHFLDEFAKENNKDIASISEEAVSVLSAYNWPGNIRELRNCVERMVVLSREKVLQVHNIPIHIRESSIPGIQKDIFKSTSLNLDKNEKLMMIKALDESSGNRTKAAEKLGISRRTLHRKLHTYGIS